jgi:hypothetical protein
MGATDRTGTGTGTKLVIERDDPKRCNCGFYDVANPTGTCVLFQTSLLNLEVLKIELT